MNFEPDWGLFNNAIGTVKEIVYAEGKSPINGDHPLYVVVSFPQYCGPIWDPENPKVRPFLVMTFGFIAYVLQQTYNGSSFFPLHSVFPSRWLTDYVKKRNVARQHFAHCSSPSPGLFILSRDKLRELPFVHHQTPLSLLSVIPETELSRGTIQDYCIWLYQGQLQSVTVTPIDQPCTSRGTR